MIEGRCHCGTVGFSISEDPERLISCNCSICHRLGALWGHIPISAVNILADREQANSYVHGDRMLAFHSCKACGCTTHWESLDPKAHPNMAVNFRMCSMEDLSRFEVKRFDGADTWQLLD